MNVFDLQIFLQQFFDHVDLVGDGDEAITGPARIEQASKGNVTFVANEKYSKYISTTKASLLIVSRQMPVDQYSNRLTFLKVKDPYTAFVFILEKFTAPRRLASPGIAPTAVIGSNVSMGSNVSIGDYAVIGDGCTIGDNSIIAPHCVLMDGVSLGDGCMLFPHVVCYDAVRIGNRVTLHSGVVIGADGFGFAPQSDGSYIKIPQMGIVEIGDDVEVGANTTIDRATMGSTVVEHGAKIDNLVQIGHNCRIGNDTVIASQTGVSGSVSIGSQCMIGGQVGMAGHLSLADHTQVAAKAGITKSFTRPGQVLRGYPAQTMKEQLRQEVLIRNLDRMKTRLEELEAEFELIRNGENPSLSR